MTQPARKHLLHPHPPGAYFLGACELQGENGGQGALGGSSAPRAHMNSFKGLWGHWKKTLRTFQRLLGRPKGPQEDPKGFQRILRGPTQEPSGTLQKACGAPIPCFPMAITSCWPNLRLHPPPWVMFLRIFVLPSPTSPPAGTSDFLRN